MRTIPTAALTAVLALAAASCSVPGSEEDEGTGADRYLSVGDSLTVGVQPDGEGLPEQTDEAYTDFLTASLAEEGHELEHQRAGCRGETTSSFLEGGNPACGDRYDGGSQVETAEDFLEENEGDVELITLSLGINNLAGCFEQVDLSDPADASNLDTDCVEEGLEQVEDELPEVTERLREAAGPDTQIVGMTYYNPFLAPWAVEHVDDPDPGTPGGELPDGRGVVDYAVGVLEQLNDTLRSAYAEQDIDVADVEARFDSGEFDVPQESTTGLPLNVQRVCDWTWMCDTDVGPDIHTNAEGAREIARVHEEQVEH
ncbi:SGNH/GDSL hydrolase family protein [Nocardiopsis sp. HNM0947]|uniref:SGNH/GDSL hydrolase family protein n=1 Tax=Nocardiopsis coralli TaxID=2772213 RepID=A0ABR9P504_9ACTN|nr:SGNH/GDSL hydrolase family protein [Nocardiopsis coralli]MBE2998914.1 SGNH/GDSL hydrolase family protein [Nocardiopsis coralli]